MPHTPDKPAPIDDAIAEALAEACASADGKLARFRANKADPTLNRTDGTYPGYFYEAQSLITRLRARGFDIVRISPATEPTDSTTPTKMPAIDDHSVEAKMTLLNQIKSHRLLPKME